MHYFKSVWNVLDVIIISISYVCIAFNIYREVKVGQLLDALLKDQNSFADFEFLTYWQIQFNNVIAFVVFLAWIKVRHQKEKASEDLWVEGKQLNFIHKSQDCLGRLALSWPTFPHP